MKIYNSYFSNPRIYGLMGFILVAVPTLLFLLLGLHLGHGVAIEILFWLGPEAFLSLCFL